MRVFQPMFPESTSRASDRQFDFVLELDLLGSEQRVARVPDDALRVKERDSNTSCE
jgi:hypothetical protein